MDFILHHYDPVTALIAFFVLAPFLIIPSMLVYGLLMIPVGGLVVFGLWAIVLAIGWVWEHLFPRSYARAIQSYRHRQAARPRAAWPRMERLPATPPTPAQRALRDRMRAKGWSELATQQAMERLKA